MKMNIPEPARKIIDRLNEHGYEAYVVGGCVRDMILKREPGDWDITTSARPEQVKALFTRTLDTGIQHGTVTIMVGKEGYEVTTFRVDGDYTDGRHPDTVYFLPPSLEEDFKSAVTLLLTPWLIITIQPGGYFSAAGKTLTVK